MSVGTTRLTCKKIAAATGCDVRRATRVIEHVERGLAAALAEPVRWSASGRADRVARGLTEWAAKAGAIARAEPQEFSRLVREALAALEGEGEPR